MYVSLRCMSLRLLCSQTLEALLKICPITTGKKVFANCLTFNFYDPEFFKEEKSYVFPRNTPKSV